MTVVFSYYWTIFGIPWNSFFFLPLLICHACFFLSFLLYSLIFSSFSLFSMSSYFLQNSICVYKPGSQVCALCRGQDDADNDDADYNAALWVGTIKSTHSIHRHRPLSHELQSERVSKRANKWAQRSTRAKRAVRCKRMSEWFTRTIEWRSKWPRTLRFDFIVISPIALMTDIDNNDADDNNADEDALLVYLAFS